jgi:hypothetical protein
MQAAEPVLTVPRIQRRGKITGNWRGEQRRVAEIFFFIFYFIFFNAVYCRIVYRYAHLNLRVSEKVFVAELIN